MFANALRKNRLAWTIHLGLLASLPVAQAQTLEEVIVEGQQLEETTPQELAKYGNRLEVITAEQIELGGYVDLSQTLQMQVPGLYVAPKNGAFDYMNCSLQGSRCEDILWLVDGVRINNRLYSTTTPLDTIPANMIERVEVLYGGQGIFYGTQSVAAVVNVVTKGFTQGTSGSVQVGSSELGGLNLNGEINLGSDRQQLVVYASKDESDGFQPFKDEAYEASGSKVNRNYDVRTGGLKYAINLTDASRLTAHYHRTEAELNFARPWKQASSTNDRTEDLLTLKWDYQASDTTDLYVKGYYHEWNTLFTRIQNDVVGGVVTGTQTVVNDNDYWGYEDYGVTAVIRNETDFGLVTSAGYDHQRFNGSDDVWLIEDKTESVNAVFLQLANSEQMFESTRLALGARYNESENNDSVVWNFSGQHDFSDQLYVRGSVGTAFRLPDAEELYLKDCCEVGNPNLQPEESRNANLGIGGMVDLAQGIHWEVSGFVRRIDHLIGIDFNNPNYPDGIFENLAGEVKLKGYEVTLNAPLTEEWQTRLSYVRTQARMDGTSDQLQDIPESNVKFALSYRSTQLPMEAELSLVRVGNVWDQVSGVGRFEHGDYTLMDLSGAWYLDAQRAHRLGFRIENLTDEEYATSLGSGRRDLDNSRYAYENLGMPRTLSFNYTFAF